MHVDASYPVHAYQLMRAIVLADASPLAVVRLNLFHRLNGIRLAIVANRLGDTAVVTDERGRTGHAAGHHAQDR